MTDHEIRRKLISIGAIVEDTHVILTSGLHGDTYINKDAIYPYTELTSDLAREMAIPFAKSEIDAVVAPALGGIILSQWLAHHLSQIRKETVLAIYAEKDSDKNDFVFRRGYDRLLPGRNILLAEDILTTGGSIRKVIRTVRSLGGKVIGLTAICNRGQLGTSDLLDIPILNALMTLKLQTWSADTCPLCKQNIPINTQVGKGSHQKPQ